MKYLLDTHILIWWLDGNKRLPMHVRKILEEQESGLYVSAVTVWEISIKKSLQKLQIRNSFFDELKVGQFSELPISFQHAQAISDLPQIHHDPFDRMLIAQAIVEKLTLITTDQDILKYEVATLKI